MCSETIHSYDFVVLFRDRVENAHDHSEVDDHS